MKEEIIIKFIDKFPNVTMGIRVPDDRDEEEYIDVMLSEMLSEKALRNVVDWEFI